MNIELSPDYGYVVLVLVLGWCVLQYLAFRVMQARKKYDVQYPTLYSDKVKEFNCYQRAHQNSLEGYPQFIVFLLIGGLYTAKLSAVFGVIFLVGRLLYAHGYYTGNPDKRMNGAIGYIGFFGLMVNCILLAVSMIQSAV